MPDRDARHKPTTVAELERAIANWKVLGWYGTPADKQKARQMLPALEARLRIAKQNGGSSESN